MLHPPWRPSLPDNATDGGCAAQEFLLMDTNGTLVPDDAALASCRERWQREGDDAKLFYGCARPPAFRAAEGCPIACASGAGGAARSPA